MIRFENEHMFYDFKKSKAEFDMSSGEEDKNINGVTKLIEALENKESVEITACGYIIRLERSMYYHDGFNIRVSTQLSRSLRTQLCVAWRSFISETQN